MYGRQCYPYLLYLINGEVMQVTQNYQRAQNAYSNTASTAASMSGKHSNSIEQEGKTANTDNVEISPEAKSLANAAKEESRVKGYYSNIPGSLADVEEELEVMKKQYSDSMNDAIVKYGINGQIAFGKFTAMDGITPSVHRPGFLVMVGKTEISESVNEHGQTVITKNDIEYTSAMKNYSKFSQSIDNDLFGKIAAYSTVLDLAKNNSDFAQMFEQNPSSAISSHMDSILGKIGYFKTEGSPADMRYVFTDDR